MLTELKQQHYGHHSYPIHKEIILSGQVGSE